MPEATPAWVWVEQIAGPGERLVLPVEPSHYVARVCRARPGEIVTLTDGRGGVARARVAATEPRVQVEIESVDRAAALRKATLLCGAAEGQRFDWVVEKLAELGVDKIRPVDCERSRWEPKALRWERWDRLARAALQQSRGRHLLRVEPPARLEEVVAAEGDAEHRFVADPDGEMAGRVGAPAAGTSVGVVGPAAGLSDAERTFLAGRGFTAIALAGSRLRTETAALAWAAWWGAGAKAQGSEKPDGGTLDGREGQP